MSQRAMKLSVLGDKIVDSMIQNDMIPQEQRPIYLFGVCQGIRICYELILMLVSGIVLGVFAETVQMLVTFIPIRIYAGGYHAKTPARCAVSSWILYLVHISAVKWLMIPGVVAAVVVAAAPVMVLLLGPVEDEQKPLFNYEKIRYREKAVYHSLFFACIALVWGKLGFVNMEKSVVMGFCMVFVVVAAGAVYQRKEKLWGKV